MSSIFEKIIAGELPAEKVFENERILAIKDINPVAPVHILLITKKTIPNIQEVESEDIPLIGEIFTVAKQLAIEWGVADNYRLLTNNGLEAGQSIFHLHFHLVGGKTLGPIA